jgi:hypothetical protein
MNRMSSARQLIGAAGWARRFGRFPWRASPQELKINKLMNKRLILIVDPAIRSFSEFNMRDNASPLHPARWGAKASNKKTTDYPGVAMTALQRAAYLASDAINPPLAFLFRFCPSRYRSSFSMASRMNTPMRFGPKG